MTEHVAPRPERFQRLNDPRRLETQVSEADLARLLALHGDEDVLDLGTGTGFYTDRIAALTTGTVYAVELLPQMNEHYRERGLPGNVRLILGDITALALEPDASAHPTTGAATAAGAAPAVGAGPAVDAAQAAGAALRPESADVACTIATWHEIGGGLDLPSVARILRPRGRLVVIDWRTDPLSHESGPPLAERFATGDVAKALAPHFTDITIENLGRHMFAITARRAEPAGG